MDDLIPISALQHYSYCPRQCAIIHIERMFAENVHTVKGQHEHERVDEPGIKRAGCMAIHTAMHLVSENLGLIGIADVVEVRFDGSLFPVEYKHGPRRQKIHDDIQIAAQAICLEEMTGKSIQEGAIYSISSKRRRIVKITPELRLEVEKIAENIRRLFDSGELPKPTENQKLCIGCSLINICQPNINYSKPKIKLIHDSLCNPDFEP